MTAGSPKAPKNQGSSSAPAVLPALILFFLSGFTALVYEVLWFRELRLLFGSTGQSAATTLSAFFTGLAAGGYYWGHRVQHHGNPLKTYAALEVGIGVSACLYFGLLAAYRLLYGSMLGGLGNYPGLLAAVKLVLALSLLFLPAFFMGGTFPAMGQYLIRNGKELGSRASLLYGANTLGAGAGAFLAGFYLPPLLGYRNSYLLAIAVNFLMALAVFAYIRSGREKGKAVPRPEEESGAEDAMRPSDTNKHMGLDAPFFGGWLRFLAFSSGFIALSLEVLWTRLFAQVLQNSVYAFSAILVIFLIALALGGFISSLLCRLPFHPASILYWLCLGAALLTGFSHPFFVYWTDGLSPINSPGGWWTYLAGIFRDAAIILLPPGILMGCLFPYLLRLGQSSPGHPESPGRTIGILVSVNTVGAIAGSLCAGFLLLPALGVFASIAWMALFYLALALLVLFRMPRKVPWAYAFPVPLVLLLALALGPKFPLVTLNHAQGEELVEVREGAQASVAVTRMGQDFSLRVNNHHVAGGTRYAEEERLMAHIPLLLHPRPDDVFFIGLGTGITAGGALYHPVRKLTAAELIPEAVTASQAHFGPWLNGLFQDPRVSLIKEDGRMHLQARPEIYDVIIGDLFNPEETGNLYTREHFRKGLSRLKPGGIMAQWLALYQMTREEFSIITRTMLEVFPQVTLWRGDFFVKYPAVALIGHASEAPLDPGMLAANGMRLGDVLGITADSTAKARHEAMPLIYYAGNLTAAKGLFRDFPLHTDDKPLVEYMTPVSPRRQSAGSDWITALGQVRLFDDIFSIAPPGNDPYLSNLKEKDLDYVRGGFSYYKFLAYKNSGDHENGYRYFRDYLERSKSDTLEASLPAWP